MSSFLALSPPYNSQKIEIDATEVQEIAAAQANPQAFEVLYQRYVTRIHRYVRTRVTSADDAADLTQQTFLNALHALPRYRSRGVPFAAWLFRIARYTVTNKYRKSSVYVSWDEVPEEIDDSPDQDPEQIMLKQERLERLRQELNQLDVQKRELLALRFAADLSSAEIAVVVGKSQAAVKKQLSRTLQKLKETYHDMAE